MPILSVWLINKSGGLVFQKDFPTDSFVIPKLSTNDFLVLASTFQSVHAISTQLNPTNSKCSGIESVEWHGFGNCDFNDQNRENRDNSGNEEFKDIQPQPFSIPFRLNCFQSPTGLKIILLTSPRQPQLDYILKRIYELYADYVMKNPFHTPEMPVRSEKFEINLGKLARQMSTNNYF